MCFVAYHSQPIGAIFLSKFARNKMNGILTEHGYDAMELGGGGGRGGGWDVETPEKESSWQSSSRLLVNQ